MHLSIREIEARDIGPLADYWFRSQPEFLQGMGVDLAKMPEEAAFKAMLEKQLEQDYRDKQSYCLIWEIDSEAIGHCNVNPIRFGEDASMHLSIWQPEIRRKGLGAQFVKMGLPFFFNNLQLKKIYSEPYALNPAPSKTLEKAGFKLVKKYVTTPGAITFEQEVCRWETDRAMQGL